MSAQQNGEGGAGCCELRETAAADAGAPAEPVDVDADALYRREGVAVVDPEQPGLSR